MLVISQQPAGTSGLGSIPGQSPTSYAPNYSATVSAAQRAAGQWTEARPIRGRLGAEGNGESGFGAIPQWVWWGGGGLLVGAVAGALIWGGSKKRRRK